MSHHSSFSMLVYDQHDSDITKFSDFSGEALRLLVDTLNQTSDSENQDRKALRKWMHGLTRSDWVKVTAKVLLDAAGSLDSLRFISEETYTHREFKSDATDSTTDPYGEDNQFTLFEPDHFDSLAEDIDRFIAWCANNVNLVIALIQWDGEGGVLKGIYHTPASKDPTEFDDEGRGIRCLMSTFKTVRELLVYAGQNGLRAVYVNTQFTSLELYRNNADLSESSPGFYGKMYQNEQYVKPTITHKPAMSVPMQGIPIDVSTLLTAMAPEVREQIKMTRPDWSFEDAISYLFDCEAALLASGRVVWAALIRSNRRLCDLARNDRSALGDVIFDPDGRMSRKRLLEEAEILVGFKGKQCSDPVMQFFADHLVDEEARIFGVDYIDVEGYALKVSTTYFCQRHLPSGLLALPHFPVLINDQYPGAVMILPRQFWPIELKEEWMTADKNNNDSRSQISNLPAHEVEKPGKSEPFWKRWFSF